jgi:hypothetical protein
LNISTYPSVAATLAASCVDRCNVIESLSTLPLSPLPCLITNPTPLLTNSYISPSCLTGPISQPSIPYLKPWSLATTCRSRRISSTEAAYLLLITAIAILTRSLFRWVSHLLSYLVASVVCSPSILWYLIAPVVCSPSILWPLMLLLYSLGANTTPYCISPCTGGLIDHHSLIITQCEWEIQQRGVSANVVTTACAR